MLTCPATKGILAAVLGPDFDLCMIRNVYTQILLKAFIFNDLSYAGF